jgi:hypothetical protein
MPRKTTDVPQKTELQTLIERVSEILDLKGLEAFVPLALAVSQEFQGPYDLVPWKCYEIRVLAARWGWSDTRGYESFRKRLVEAGVTIYSTGKSNGCDFVLLQDVMDNGGLACPETTPKAS